MGDLSSKLRLRKRDELQDLADAINNMTDDLKNRVHKLRGISNMAGLELEKLRRILGRELPDIKIVKSEVDELAKSIKELEDHLSEYRLTTVED
jgi:methyl-accepting chemotaxis protein